MKLQQTELRGQNSNEITKIWTQRSAVYLKKSLWKDCYRHDGDLQEERKRERERESDIEEKRDKYTYISKFYFTSLDSCVRNYSFSYNYVI